MSDAACPNSAAIYKEHKKPPDLFDPAVLNIRFSCSLYSGLLPLFGAIAFIMRHGLHCP
jgi:hypothetical protein